MSEADAVELLDRLAQQLPPTLPPTAAILRGGHASRRRRYARHTGAGIATMAVLAGLVGGALSTGSPVDNIPATSTRLPESPPGTHWVGGSGALLAVPDDGTVSLTTRPFMPADSERWSISPGLFDGKPVDTVTRGPGCVSELAQTRCEARMAIPSLGVLLIVRSTGQRAQETIRTVLDSLTYVAPDAISTADSTP